MPPLRPSLLLRVIALAVVALAAFTSSKGAQAQQRVGVNSAVNPDATGAPPTERCGSMEFRRHRAERYRREATRLRSTAVATRHSCAGNRNLF